MPYTILVIGDLHIPSRASEIPRKILEFITSRTFDVVVATGDYTAREVLDFISRLGRVVYAVRGNMDYLDLPKRHVFKLEEFTFGVVHGDEVYPRGDVAKLAKLACKMGVDVLFHGHTHSLSIDEVVECGRKILLVNPGSATGVWSGGGGSLVPSFAVVSVAGAELVVHGYELVGNDFRVVTHVFRKR